MSYIGKPFEHDLFVSYSHGTIEGAGLSPLKRWSDGFIRELESELRVHPKFGRDLVLFSTITIVPTRGWIRPPDSPSSCDPRSAAPPSCRC